MAPPADEQDGGEDFERPHAMSGRGSERQNPRCAKRMMTGGEEDGCRSTRPNSTVI